MEGALLLHSRQVQCGGFKTAWRVGSLKHSFSYQSTANNSLKVGLKSWQLLIPASKAGSDMPAVNVWSKE